MTAPALFMNPSAAASRIGVSVKALRLYEERGLVSPGRTPAGWRAYGPAEMKRAAEIAALRALGFSLAQVERVLAGDLQGLEPALAAHQAMLEGQLRHLARLTGSVRDLRASLVAGAAPSVEELARLAKPAAEPVVGFDLPWPWGGERFELRDIRSLNYIIGPLGSGKTRLAQRLAELIPGAVFVGLDRLADGGQTARDQLDDNPDLRSRVQDALAWIVEEGASISDALVALLVALAAEGPAVLVIDMIEQGLDETAQQALMAHLRRRGPQDRPIFILTRSSAILDLCSIGADETIILCPANHSPPTRVAPHSGSPGYESVATCLASPAVRARTEGVIAWRPGTA